MKGKVEGVLSMSAQTTRGFYHDEILKLLKDLKENHGVVAIKAEFEAEGSRKDELIMLREFVYQADLGFIIKIGGCEAVHDLDQCKLLDATGIMAPMIETPFAMSKFKNAAKKVYGDQLKRVEWIINAETKTCLENYKEIMDEGDGFLTGVTVGRSDLSASLGIERKDIESEPVFNATKKLVEESKAHHLVTNFGGNISVDSIPFIQKLSDQIDRFETRKVVISVKNDPEEIKSSIEAALRFELAYLQFKREYYNTMATEDLARIDSLKQRLL